MKDKVITVSNMGDARETSITVRGKDIHHVEVNKGISSWYIRLVFKKKHIDQFTIYYSVESPAFEDQRTKLMNYLNNVI